jgi:hypothetical protein
VSVKQLLQADSRIDLRRIEHLIAEDGLDGMPIICPRRQSPFFFVFLLVVPYRNLERIEIGLRQPTEFVNVEIAPVAQKLQVRQTFVRNFNHLQMQFLQFR